ncbi:MAG TPA: DUF58 domain-containing protein [Phycisphaerae bacterium]|nr:DUF58 domain-containing protein [Phycisphaerae bacterium]
MDSRTYVWGGGMDGIRATRAGRFLDLRALACLDHLRFSTRHRIEGSYSGRHSSRRQGGAGEFVDFREYVEGEDLRRLDWKVLARTGRAYLRLYRDETNLACTLAIDASGSMRFAGRGAGGVRGSKLEYAQYLATALSHVITRQQDQAGLALLAEGLEAHVPPGSTPAHAAGIQRAIEGIETRPVTDLATGLRELFGRVVSRGVLVVMSDFLVDDLERVFASVRLFRHRHWEVVILHLVDPDEERLPEGLAYRFVGLEDEGQVDCSPAEIRGLYEERFAAYAGAVRTLALAAGCDYRWVSTAVPYLQTLGGFLVERSL